MTCNTVTGSQGVIGVVNVITPGPVGPQGPAGSGGSGSGTVTSVGLSLPAIFSVTNSPVTTSGTLTGTLTTQLANLFLAGPTTGSAAIPAFRALVAADLPNTTVAAGSYTYGSFTVDGSGRITIASSGSAATTSLTGLMSSSDKTKLDAITGTNTGDNAVNSLYSGLVSNANHTGDATGSTALTLATVNTNVGSFGSATVAPIFTVNSKGLITAASTATITPAVGNITGLGTGIATALAINTGTAGAPVLFGGALGTPSSATLTNATALPLTTGVTGLLPVANGGTGTATPALVQGTNVTITGSWPNQTINATGGGGSALTVQDEGSTLSTAVTLINFTGAGVTAAGTSSVTVNVPAGSGGNVSNSGTPTSGQAAEWTSATVIQGVAVTGTGSYVKATSPTLVTPILGTPTSGTLTNCTGLPAAGVTGLGTLATQSGTFSGTSSGTNTGDQTITLTGEVTGSGTGSFAATLTNSSVIGKVLTGYISGAGAVAATDSILQAIQKLNGNDAAFLTSATAATTYQPLTSNLTALGANNVAYYLDRANHTGTQAGSTVTGVYTSAGLTMATARLLGRSTAGSGAAEEITIGTGLSLSAGTLTATGGGGSGTPGGATTQVQFNDAGAFAGDADLTWNKTTNVLGITGDVNLSDGGAFTTTLQTITATAARTISFPDATGTVALVAGSSGQLIYNNAGAYAGGPLFSLTTGTLGYTAGGTVTQATNKTTGVTLNGASGRITMSSAPLALDTTVSFTLTNSSITANDLLILNHVSGGTAGSYLLNAQAAAGSALISVRNITAGVTPLSEAIVIGFAVIKA